METDFWEDVAFVQRSDNRERVMGILVDAGRPMTPTELAERTGVVVKSSSRAVRQLNSHGLVECVNPEAPRDRRYRPTERGREIWSQIEELEEREEQRGEFAEPELEYRVEDIPGELQDEVSYLRLSGNRRSVAEALYSSDVPLTPSELSEEMGVDFNSASRAVRQLSERGLAECVNPGSKKYRRYALTEKGERVYSLLSP